MGPAVESFLTFALPVILVATLGATVFRQSLSRLARYFRAWRDRDLALDAEEAECRRAAEAEVDRELRTRS